jgi:hypothetical protein
VETRTAGSASGLGKRTGSNAGTAPQADSTVCSALLSAGPKDHAIVGMQGLSQARQGSLRPCAHAHREWRTAARKSTETSTEPADMNRYGPTRTTTSTVHRKSQTCTNLTVPTSSGRA